MKRFIVAFFLAATFLTNAMAAGWNDYTYQREKRFEKVEQVIGQTFVPQEYAAGYGNHTEVEAGDVKIHFTTNTVKIEGIEGIGTYTIVAKSKSRTGYDFKLADSRGYELSELKLLLDRDKYVAGIYFYSRKSGELSFTLPEKTQSQLQKERNYFTAKTANKVSVFNDLMGKNIMPAKYLTNTEQAVMESISINDKFGFKFNEGKVSISSLRGSKTYNVKRSKQTKYQGKDPKVKNVLQVKLTDTKQPMKLYLNEQHQIEYIELNNTKYFLM